MLRRRSSAATKADIEAAVTRDAAPAPVVAQQRHKRHESTEVDETHINASNPMHAPHRKRLAMSEEQIQQQIQKQVQEQVQEQVQKRLGQFQAKQEHQQQIQQQVQQQLEQFQQQLQVLSSGTTDRVPAADGAHSAHAQMQMQL